MASLRCILNICLQSGTAPTSQSMIHTIPNKNQFISSYLWSSGQQTIKFAWVSTLQPPVHPTTTLLPSSFLSNIAPSEQQETGFRLLYVTIVLETTVGSENKAQIKTDSRHVNVRSVLLIWDFLNHDKHHPALEKLDCFCCSLVHTTAKWGLLQGRVTLARIQKANLLHT